MQNWLEIEEFSRLVKLDMETIDDMIQRGKLSAKEENGQRYVEATKGTVAVMPKEGTEVMPSDEQTPLVGASFVEKTIGTILTLHDKVLDAKDETVEALKDENKFLKEALFSMQEVYDEDKKTISTLSDQLKISQEEIEFVKRKYKLMWGKVIDENSQKGDE